MILQRRAADAGDWPGHDGDHDAIKPIYIVEAKGGKWTLLDTRNAE